MSIRPFLFTAIVCALTAAGSAAHADRLSIAIAKSKRGDTIVLPVGRFAGGVMLPPGVSLRGAGYDKTIIDSSLSAIGLTIKGGKGASISDLTVRGAMQTDVVVQNAEAVTVRRVRTISSVNGIIMTRVNQGRIENVICADNRYGIIASGGVADTIVNCTLVRNTSIGVSLPSGINTVAFNNCITESATAVYLGASLDSPRLDNNLYFDLFVGKMDNQVGRRSLLDWQYLSGLDKRSVSMPVVFRNAASGDYRPNSALGWAQNRYSTSQWGVSSLGDMKAPALDIRNAHRSSRPSVGAFESDPTPSRPPDGYVTVRADAGIKSAGLFTKQGYEVAYLFQNLPLPKGRYPVWFPSRDYLNRSILAGSYDVRVAESALSWEYLGWIGDSGDAYPSSRTASVNPSMVVFDNSGHLFMGQGWSEDATNVRAFDASSGKLKWYFRGSDDITGLSLDARGMLYLLRSSGGKQEYVVLNPATGKVMPAESSGALVRPVDAPATAHGMTVRGQHLLIADRAGNALLSRSTGYKSEVPVPEPSSPCTDPKTGLTWLLSGADTVVAIDGNNRFVVRSSPQPDCAALAANGGLVAIASHSTGRVHIYDASDPRNLRLLRTVGSGDGPYGPSESTRFLFRRGPHWPGCACALALGANGELAVTERNRLLVFDSRGRPIWHTFGLFGNGTAPAYDDKLRVFDTDGRTSLRLNEKASAWQVEAFWDIPFPEGKYFFLGSYAAGGGTFGAFLVDADGVPGGSLVIVRYDGFRAIPVLEIARDTAKRAYVMRTSAAGTAPVDPHDAGVVLTSRDGAPLAGPLFSRHCSLQPNGDLLFLGAEPGTYGTVWKLSGVNAAGVPIYEALDRVTLPRPVAGITSPYNFKPEPDGGLSSAALLPGGGYVAATNMRSSPGGSGLLNGNGTDIACYDLGGRLRWFHPLSDRRGIYGLSVAGPVAITGVAQTAEILAVNRDGLGLGGFGQPASVRYEGFFLDHPEACRAYIGDDNETYALVADNYDGRHHWYRLHGQGTIHIASFPVALSQKTARLHAALPMRPVATVERPTPPTVHIPHLRHGLSIDGDMEKWRTAGIAPQIVVTPETGSGGIDGPRDCSAIIRLAWEGSDLYAQFIVFDNVVSFHQAVDKHYKQDGVEVCLNGFMSGFKFDATITTDAGPILLRNRFYFKNLDYLLPPDLAPRSIKVLNSARDIPERTLIESVYGIDLGSSKVIVTEFKLPINENTYRDSVKDIIAMQPGTQFRLGFLINDNDEPGADIQKYLVWPATYGNFNPVEDGALAILDQ